MKKLLKNLIIFAVFILFFIPLNEASAVQAKLKIAHNDGLQCFLNNREFLNTLTEPQTERYWNKEIDVSAFLQSGRNLLACRVSNGDGNAGSGIGYFDVELMVNDVSTAIPRSSSDWRYFGTSGSTASPGLDTNNRYWYDLNYNDSNWYLGSTPFDGRTGSVLKKSPDDAWFRKFFNAEGFSSGYPAYQSCSYFTNRPDCLNRFDCTWSGSNCVDSSSVTCSSFTTQTDCVNRAGCAWTGSTCTIAGILSCSYFNTKVSCLSNAGCLWTGSYCLNSYLATCSSFNNQADCSSKTGCSWINSSCVDVQYLYNQDLFRIKTLSLTGCWNPIVHRLDNYLRLPPNIEGLVLESPKPLITGLLKYGNQIEVFVDDNSIGKAVVKEGESSGVSNFYFKPKENIVPITNDLTIHQLKIVAFNPHDQSVCVTGPFAFIITPYPAPIIHRLGEISYVKRANILSIKTKEPIVSGLVKYGSAVEIYIDNKMVGKAKIKEGEKTGIANFYLTIPKLTVGKHTLYAVAKKASQSDIESPASQVYEFTVE